jgi:hypothetical protein
MEYKIIKEAQSKTNYGFVWLIMIVGAIFLVSAKRK